MHKIMKSVLVCSFHRYSILKRDKTFRGFCDVHL